MIGASLLNTITESLYDNPIVVFREYVQNSVDSFRTLGREKKDDLSVRIFADDESILFLDNGNGVPAEAFESKMKDLGNSNKRKTSDIGYKGIGRLSGLPYCEKLVFVNILSYKEKQLQGFILDGEKYKDKNKKGELNEEEYEVYLEKISETHLNPDPEFTKVFFEMIADYEQMFQNQDTGFCVCLISPSNVLKETIAKEGFVQELSWLLPVRFDKSIYSCEDSDAFEELETPFKEGNIPAESHKIFFNDVELSRPFFADNLRKFTCLRDFEYGAGVYTFNDTRLEVEKKNVFSGIRVYLDNMLLCDENELIPALERFGFLGTKSINEMILAVRTIGALIYITNKDLISANARRTFIEISDDFALDLLKRMAVFVKEINTARYALSKYQSAIKKEEQNQDKLEGLEAKATAALAELAREESIKVTTDVEERHFEQLSLSERRSIVRKKITQYCNNEIKKYIDQLSEPRQDDAVESFQAWLKTRLDADN